MKKLIIIILLCGWAFNLYALPPFFSYGGGGTVSGEVNVSNDAYDATTWDNDEINAPSRNAVRDKFESLDGDYQPLDTDLTDLATGSPTGTYDLSGATITFGLEDADIPASIARDSELPTATSLHLDDVLTALGIASEDENFGTFTGSTIGANLTAKAIFQALETAIESIEVGPGADLLDSETGKLDLAYFPDLSGETLTVTELNIVRQSGYATVAEWYEDPDNGDNKVTVTVPASMDSDTTFNLVEVYNSMTTLRDAIGEGSPGSGLPEGGTLNQIIVMTSEGAAWMDFDDHPAYTTLLNAFNAAGLNTFTFTPHEFGLNSTGYVSSVPFPVSFEIIPSSETYAVDSAEWKIDSGEYASMSYNGGSGYWEATELTGAEGSHTLTLKATDDKPTTPNSGEEEFTFVVDTTDPVIDLEAGANPTTHDGSGTDTWDLQIGMITEANIASVQYRLTVDGGATPEWSTWAAPRTTTGIELPEEEEDLYIAVRVDDLAGNWTTGGITVALGSASATDFTADASCEGAWNMSGSSTTEMDLSGNGNTLTEAYDVDGIPRTADYPSGFSGYSRDFEASDTEYMTNGADGGSLDIYGADQAITVSIWIKSETTDYTTSAHVAGKNDTLQNQRQYRIGITSGELAEFRLSSNGTASTAAVGTTNVADGAWHHIAGVYNDTDIRIYVDGELDGDAVSYTDGIYDGTAEFHIGGDSVVDTLLAYDGLVYEPIVFSRALSASEIAEIYTNGINGAKGVYE